MSRKRIEIGAGGGLKTTSSGQDTTLIHFKIGTNTFWKIAEYLFAGKLQPPSSWNQRQRQLPHLLQVKF